MAGIGGVALLGMVAVTVGDVVGRQFGYPIRGAYDIVKILGGVAIGSAIPLTKAVKGHIAIEFFFQKLGRTGRALTDTLMRLLVLAFFSLLSIQFIRFGFAFRESGERTQTLHLPVFWVQWILAAGCLVTVGVTLWHLLHPGRSMMRPKS